MAESKEINVDYSQSFAISAAGMSVERLRVDVAALNLANANTVQGVGGVTYQPLRVVAAAGNPAIAGTAASGFGVMFDQGLEALNVAESQPLAHVVASNVPSRMVYEPSHPLADTRGYVSYSAVDVATEMVSMMSATRAYEANVSAMNTTRTLALRALDIGGNA